MKPDKPFTLHDLRRTLVTGMAELGFDRDLIELCVNHVSGSRGGIAGTYNRSERMAERRVAFQRWADHIDQIVRADSFKAVSFPHR
jgi:integrase